MDEYTGTGEGISRPLTVLLAGPRAFCAGVERAIKIVELLLEKHGAPVYVRRQIVHNSHVVRDLEQRGAVFVKELGEVPRGATVVFSAHGVSPAVRAEATERGLFVVDATCPMVAKVHAEARRYARHGDTIVFVGHASHDEAEGTIGEAPDQTVVISSEADAAALNLTGPVSYVMQTTLAVDEAEGVVHALKQRFPHIEGPRSDDVCYATTNRQEAVRNVARDADVVLVIGSVNSANSMQLVHVAAREGCPAYLIDDAGQIDPGVLRDVKVVGLTAGASTSPALVSEVIDALRALGPVRVEERMITKEATHFGLPPQVMRP